MLRAFRAAEFVRPCRALTFPARFTRMPNANSARHSLRRTDCYCPHPDLSGVGRSLAGARIETVTGSLSATVDIVAPSRERGSKPFDPEPTGLWNRWRRSLAGARIETASMRGCSAPSAVSLPRGSADRNLISAAISVASLVSLPRGSADRNEEMVGTFIRDEGVAPSRERGSKQARSAGRRQGRCRSLAGARIETDQGPRCPVWTAAGRSLAGARIATAISCAGSSRRATSLSRESAHRNMPRPIKCSGCTLHKDWTKSEILFKFQW